MVAASAKSPPPLLHTVTYATKALGLSAEFIRAAARTNKIRTVKCGRRTMVPADELLRIAREGVR